MLALLVLILIGLLLWFLTGSILLTVIIALACALIVFAAGSYGYGPRWPRR